MSVRKNTDVIESHIVRGRCCIYLCCMPMPDSSVTVKVGMSGSPMKRLHSLSTSLPFPYAMLYAVCDSRNQALELESSIHREFDDFRTRGEWFMFTENHGPFFEHVVDVKYQEKVGRKPHWLIIDNTDSAAPNSLGASRKSHSLVGGDKVNCWECAYCGAPKSNTHERYCDDRCVQADKIKPLTSDRIWAIICMLHKNAA